MGTSKPSRPLSASRAAPVRPPARSPPSEYPLRALLTRIGTRVTAYHAALHDLTPLPTELQRLVRAYMPWPW